MCIRDRVINCAVTGTVPRTRDTANSWNMSAAKTGDVVLVSGDFGNSITGRHLTFEPRVKLASYLAQRYQINGATDITDSLAIDLAAVAKKSGGGVRINLADIPVSAAAQKLDGTVAVGNDAPQTIPASVAAALFDGEDFELAVTVTPETAEKILADKDCPCGMTSIGSIISSASFEVVGVDGQVTKILPRGYEH